MRKNLAIIKQRSRLQQVVKLKMNIYETVFVLSNNLTQKSAEEKIKKSGSTLEILNLQKTDTED